MFSFFTKKPSLGIEITASSVRLALMSGNKPGNSVLFADAFDLPAGLVSESYASSNISNAGELSRLIKDRLAENAVPLQRAALSLPDGLFRVQSLEFDDLPKRRADRERLIRWRLEKGAAIDLSETVLQYELLQQRSKTVAVLACIAKRSVLQEYEDILLRLGMEPWVVGLSSLLSLNLYAPRVVSVSGSTAFAQVSDTAFTTMVLDGAGTVRFYRFKELKRSGAHDVTERLISEIEDSIHFYTHRDRTQIDDVQQLFISGDSADLTSIARGMSAPLQATVLTPEDVIAPAQWRGTKTRSSILSAAMGAGSAV